MCVCLVGEGLKKIRNKCDKGKGKEGETHLLVSVMNSRSAQVVKLKRDRAGWVARKSNDPSQWQAYRRL